MTFCFVQGLKVIYQSLAVRLRQWEHFASQISTGLLVKFPARMSEIYNVPTSSLIARFYWSICGSTAEPDIIRAGFKCPQS
jgi:hypothetical protein